MSGTEIEMNSTPTSRPRSITQDANAWRDAARVNYTTALRLIEDPLSQGILGKRVSVRSLLRTLNEHPVIRDRPGVVTFGRNGLNAGTPMRDDLSMEVLREVLMVAEFLRMFTVLNQDELQHDRTAWVDSYPLKGMAERFLGDAVHGYVSSGSLIWAAAALRIPLKVTDPESMNALVGISRLEYDYIAVDAQPWHGKWPRGEHFQPPGYLRLRRVLSASSRGQPIGDDLVTPLASRQVPSDFHTWLVAQGGRRGWIGQTARDYAAGIEVSEHRMVEGPDDFELLLLQLFPPIEFVNAGMRLIREWKKLNSM